MNSPKVSIITPSFNQGSYIEETINSVLSQTYENIEYIIIDGGSTDSTISILSKYEGKVSAVISEPDAGQADAINKGLRMASGEFLTWLNSDDLLERDAIERCVNEFLENPGIGFVYGNVKLINERSVVVGMLNGEQVSRPSVFFNLDLPIPQQGGVWRRDVSNAIGLLDDQWHYVLDREFFLRICLNSDVRYLNETLGSFRLHHQSKSVSNGTAWISELPALYSKLVESSLWRTRMECRFTRMTVASAHINVAYMAFRRGYVGLGLKEVASAFKAYPMIFICGHIYSKPINKLGSLYRYIFGINK